MLWPPRLEVGFWGFGTFEVMGFEPRCSDSACLNQQGPITLGLLQESVLPWTECRAAGIRSPNLCLKQHSGEECRTCSSWRTLCTRCESYCANFLIMQERLGRRHSLGKSIIISAVLQPQFPSFLVPVAFEEWRFATV